jgi:hypothetical protein
MSRFSITTRFPESEVRRRIEGVVRDNDTRGGEFTGKVSGDRINLMPVQGGRWVMNTFSPRLRGRIREQPDGTTVIEIVASLQPGGVIVLLAMFVVSQSPGIWSGHIRIDAAVAVASVCVLAYVWGFVGEVRRARGILEEALSH